MSDNLEKMIREHAAAASHTAVLQWYFTLTASVSGFVRGWERGNIHETISPRFNRPIADVLNDLRDDIIDLARPIAEEQAISTAFYRLTRDETKPAEPVIPQPQPARRDAVEAVKEAQL